MSRPHRAGVSSFGMHVPPAPDPADPVVLIPPILLDSVHLPVVLVVDPDSVARLADTIRDAVTAAVLAGVETAMDALDRSDDEDPAGNTG